MQRDRLHAAAGRSSVRLDTVARTGLIARSARLACWGLAAGLLVSTAAAQQRPTYTMTGHVGAVGSIQFTPDDKLIATFASEEPIFIWELDKHKVLKKLIPSGKSVDGRSSNYQANDRRRLEALAINGEGVLAAASVEPGLGGTLRFWDIAKGEITKQLLRDASSLRAIAFSPDGKQLAAAMRDGERSDHKIAIYDVSTGNVVKEMKADRLSATKLAWTPDGKTLVSAGGTVIHTWDVAKGVSLKKMTTHKKAIQDLAVSPDGEQFATGDADETIRLWSTREGRLQREIKHEQTGILALAYSPNGATLASGGTSGVIKLWNPKSGRAIRSLYYHSDAVTALQYSHDGKLLASGSKDQTIGIWEARDEKKDESGK